MIGTSVRVGTDRPITPGVERARKRYLLDGAQKGFNVSQDHVPHGADSFLANQSAVEPTELSDGTVVWGYNAEYAQYVEEGTAPHWVPIAPLKRWAKRVLGSVRAAYPVQWTIAQEGTDAQPYVEPGVEAMKRWFRSHDFGDYLDRELGLR